MISRPQADLRLLLVAPTARDGEVSQALFASARIECVLCPNLQELSRQLSVGAAAVVLPEEMVLADDSRLLAHVVASQPVWSDLPIIVLTRSGIESPAGAKALATLGNVTLLERPARISTLVSLVRAALRARERQYQVRDHLAEQFKAEQALRVARDEAQAASRAKDQFLAALSHELRTPLSPVMMAITSMLRDPQLPPRLVADLEMARRNIELEAKLIDDLLDVSRAINGKLRLRRERVGLHELLRHVLEVCESDRLSKRLKIETSFAAKEDCVSGDAARLEQVFWNLLKNAIKFSYEGQTILVRTGNFRPGAVSVEIKDSGAGIPVDVLPRLFLPFEQGDPNVTRRFGGLGLGLAISKAVVDLHGGSIAALSEGPDTGATLVVELATADPAQAPASGDAGPRCQEPGALPRVLLVEDHVDTANMLSRLLSLSGYPVTTAHTVAAALELARTQAFDLVISDIGLPDATGYDLMRQIRDRHGIKGIALSGYGMEEDMRRSQEAGFVDHVVKPVNVEQLESVIQRLAARGHTPRRAG